MMNSQSKTVDKSNSTLEDRLFEFLELSQKIKTIIAHENAILDTCGCLSLEAYIAHRNALLQSYEHHAEILCHEVACGQFTDDVAQDLLIGEMASVKDTLADNTKRQFDTLEATLLKAMGDQAWH